MADPASGIRHGDDPALAWGHPARVFDLAFSPLSADVVASGAEDGTARVWRRSAEDAYLWKQTVCCYGGHNSEVLRVVWHPSGRLLATGGAEGAVRLWRADGSGGDDGGGGDAPSSTPVVTYAPPIDPLESEHPEEIYSMIFASRGGGGGGGGGGGAAGAGNGGGGAGGGGELLLTASAEALYVWDLETGKLLQGAPAPEARLLGTRAERVPMPPWRGPRTGRAGAAAAAGGAGGGEAGGEEAGGDGGKQDDKQQQQQQQEGEDEDEDEDDQPPPPNYPKEMPVYVFGMAQVGGGAPPSPSLLAAGCCDGTLRLWAFQASAARVQPLFGAHAHAPGEMASFVHVLAPQAEDTPAGGGSGAAGAGGPYVVSVSRGGQATVFDARRLVAAGATAGVMTPAAALSAGVVQRHWLDGPSMGGAVVAAGEEPGGGGRRPLMLATVGADGRVRCYEARALLQPPPPPPAAAAGGGGRAGKEDKEEDDDEDDDDYDDDDGPPILRPARILRAPGPALRAPLLSVAASADGGAVAAAGFPVEAGALSREEQRLRHARLEAAAGGGESAASRSVRRAGAAGAAVAGRRRRERPAAPLAVGGGGGDDDDGSGLFAALSIGTPFGAAGGGVGGGGGGARDKKKREEGEGGGDGQEEDEEDQEERPPPKCEGESVSARAAVFVWRLGGG